MRFSRTGLIFSGFYIALALVLLFAAAVADDDIGAFTYSRLSVLPGVMLVAGTGLGAAARGSWLDSSPALLLLSIMMAYGLGWAIEGLLALPKAWLRPR